MVKSEDYMPEYDVTRPIWQPLADRSEQEWPDEADEGIGYAEAMYLQGDRKLVPFGEGRTMFEFPVTQRHMKVEFSLKPGSVGRDTIEMFYGQCVLCWNTLAECTCHERGLD